MDYFSSEITWDFESTSASDKTELKILTNFFFKKSLKKLENFTMVC